MRIFGGGGVQTFPELTDTPENYTGSGGKYAKVNVGEDALEFDTPSGGASFNSRCAVGLASNQSIPASSATKVLFATEVYDDNNEFASNRFTAEETGYYHVDVSCNFPLDASKMSYYKLEKNGASIALTFDLSTGEGNTSPGSSVDIYLEANDYLEAFVFHNCAGAKNLMKSPGTYLTIHRFG